MVKDSGELVLPGDESGGNPDVSNTENEIQKLLAELWPTKGPERENSS